MSIALVIAQVLAATAPSVAAAPADQARLDACIARVDADPAAAYEDAMAWAHEEMAREARWCAAQAMVKLGRLEEAARRFETLAADLGWPEDNRLDAYSQAGNAWLLARNAARAREAFDHAVRLSDRHPDALIDRARAYAMLEDWSHAEEDLSAALDKRPADPLALMLRATTRMKRSAFDLAVRDAEEAVRLDPRNIDALVALGQAREAQRTNHAP
jgi:tetratricopeptide (TPR) repeat protein